MDALFHSNDKTFSKANHHNFAADIQECINYQPLMLKAINNNHNDNNIKKKRMVNETTTHSRMGGTKMRRWTVEGKLWLKSQMFNLRHLNNCTVHFHITGYIARITFKYAILLSFYLLSTTSLFVSSSLVYSSVSLLSLSLSPSNG